MMTLKTVRRLVVALVLGAYASIGAPWAVAGDAGTFTVVGADPYYVPATTDVAFAGPGEFLVVWTHRCVYGGVPATTWAQTQPYVTRDERLGGVGDFFLSA